MTLKYETTTEEPMPDGYEINVFKWKGGKRLDSIAMSLFVADAKELKNDPILERAVRVLDKKIESGNWEN